MTHWGSQADFEWGFGKPSGKASGGAGEKLRCHEEHPELALGGGVVLGASCVYPREGYRIYVGLDRSMHQHPLALPWVAESKRVVQIAFAIPDGGVPKDAEQFAAMIDWLVTQLAQGGRVHVGCLGGHGRTGMVLAALRCRAHKDENAGEWVRKHYCKSAIETSAQMAFLKKHFGIAPVSVLRGAHAQSPKKALSEPHRATSFAPIQGRSFWAKGFLHARR